MRLHIETPWRHTKNEAEEDRKYLRNLFKQNHSHGLRTVILTDHKEYRADICVESNDFIVSC